MGFYIKEEIETKLHCEDVLTIATIFQEHLDTHGEKVDPVRKAKMMALVRRLYYEMYNHPENDKPNGH